MFFATQSFPFLASGMLLTSAPDFTRAAMDHSGFAWVTTVFGGTNAQHGVSLRPAFGFADYRSVRAFGSTVFEANGSAFRVHITSPSQLFPAPHECGTSPAPAR